MKKILFTTITILFLAAACNKQAAVSPSPNQPGESFVQPVVDWKTYQIGGSNKATIKYPENWYAYEMGGGKGKNIYFSEYDISSGNIKFDSNGNPSMPNHCLIALYPPFVYGTTQRKIQASTDLKLFNLFTDTVQKNQCDSIYSLMQTTIVD